MGLYGKASSTLKYAWLSVMEQSEIQTLYIVPCPFSVALCDTLHKQCSLISYIRPLADIFHNPSFPPGMNIQAFSWWLNKGLFSYRTFNSMGPISLGYCLSKLEMPISEKFRLSQIRHLLNSIWSDKNEPAKSTPYEQ